jgi:hypothetical protein
MICGRGDKREGRREKRRRDMTRAGYVGRCDVIPREWGVTGGGTRGGTGTESSTVMR